MQQRQQVDPYLQYLDGGDRVALRILQHHSVEDQAVATEYEPLRAQLTPNRLIHLVEGNAAQLLATRWAGEIRKRDHQQQDDQAKNRKKPDTQALEPGQRSTLPGGCAGQKASPIER